MKFIPKIFNLLTILVLVFSNINCKNTNDNLGKKNQFLQEILEFHIQDLIEISEINENLDQNSKIQLSQSQSQVSEILQEFILNQNNIFNSQNQNKITAQNCTKCKLAISGINATGILKNTAQKYLTSAAKYLCAIKLELFPQNVCDGTIDEIAPYFMQALWDHYFSANFLCPALEFCEPVYEKVDIDALISEIVQDKPQKEKLVPTSGKTFKFLQFTDVHTSSQYDTKYKSNCGTPECCIPGSGLAVDPKDRAQYWGTKATCDIPQRTFEKMLDYIKKYVNDIDFALWTGDNTSHNIWEQTAEANFQSSVDLTNVIKEKLPDLNVFPLSGNQDLFPVNLYDFQSGQEDTFNSAFADLWSSWLGEEASKQLKENGFYETIIPGKNIKLIALNTQAGDHNNFMLISNPTDPSGMLAFLRKSLQTSEDNEQPVYIMGHIPSGVSTMNTFAKVYAAIVERYSYTIRGIFTGHTHHDEFEIFYNQKQSEVVSVNWVSPSVTTWKKKNPSFRVFEVDSETFQVMNIHQYRLDLDYWNQFTDPNTELLFEKAYSFVQEYNLPNMWDLNNLETLRYNIGNNLRMYNKFMNNYNTGNYNEKSKVDFNQSCKLLAIPENIAYCQGKYFMPEITEIITGPWIQKIQKKSNEESNPDFESINL